MREFCLRRIERRRSLHVSLNCFSLEGHLRSCATRVLSGKDAAERERVIGEIVDVIAAQGRG